MTDRVDIAECRKHAKFLTGACEREIVAALDELEAARAVCDASYKLQQWPSAALYDATLAYRKRFGGGA